MGKACRTGHVFVSLLSLHVTPVRALTRTSVFFCEARSGFLGDALPALRLVRPRSLGLRRVGLWQGQRRATEDDAVQERPRAVGLCSRAGPSGLARSFPAAEFCNSGAPLRLSPQDASPVWLPQSQDTRQSPEGLPLVPPHPPRPSPISDRQEDQESSPGELPGPHSSSLSFPPAGQPRVEHFRQSWETTKILS